MQRHRTGLLSATLLAVLVVTSGALLAQAPTSSGSGANISVHGNGRGAPACVTCHGPQLQGNAASGVPRLTGLSTAYVQAQLDAFASSTRKSPIMLPVATSLSQAERDSLAAYLGRLPVGSTPPESAAVDQPAGGATRLGEILATRGRWSSKIPACDRCHGPGGVGVGTTFPPLAGQPASYLEGQLDAWKNGLRPPGPLDLMSTIAGRMSQSDIQAVAAYYANQPASPPAAKGGRP